MNLSPGSVVSSIFFVLLVACPLLTNAQTGVKVTSENALLYNRPRADISFNIGVQEGDIFEVQEFLGDWIRIHLFSGGERYIKNEQVEVVNGFSPYPSDPAVRNELCVQTQAARAKASKEAMIQHSGDVNRQGIQENLLFDKYLLDIFREFEIPAAHYSKLAECVDRGIMRSIRIEN